MNDCKHCGASLKESEQGPIDDSGRVGCGRVLHEPMEHQCGGCGRALFRDLPPVGSMSGPRWHDNRGMTACWTDSGHHVVK
jgi:hypothetical protein